MRRRYLILAAMSAFAIIAAAGLDYAIFGLSDGGNAVTGVGAFGGPFTLIDDTGTPVSEKTLAGKPYVMYFGYTFCPEVCPTTLFDLSRWIKDLGPAADKLNYVFVSVDPERDTVQLMHTYLSSFDKRIRGYTGTSEQIAKIAKEYHVYYKKISTDDGNYVMDHSAMIYLMGPNDKFVTLIRYQEDDASALAKLRKLAAMAPVS
jgi:protein SCO1/2